MHDAVQSTLLIPLTYSVSRSSLSGLLVGTLIRRVVEAVGEQKTLVGHDPKVRYVLLHSEMHAGTSAPTDQTALRQRQGP